MPRTRRLEDQVLAALRHALAEERLETAEHLLRALEALSPEALPGSPLAAAYLAVARKQEPARSDH
jgi:hypothetical protein